MKTCRSWIHIPTHLLRAPVDIALPISLLRGFVQLLSQKPKESSSRMVHMCLVKMLLFRTERLHAFLIGMQKVRKQTVWIGGCFQELFQFWKRIENEQNSHFQLCWIKNKVQETFGWSVEFEASRTAWASGVLRMSSRTAVLSSSVCAWPRRVQYLLTEVAVKDPWWPSYVQHEESPEICAQNLQSVLQQKLGELEVLVLQHLHQPENKQVFIDKSSNPLSQSKSSRKPTAATKGSKSLPVLTLLQVFNGQNWQDLLLRGNTLVGILSSSKHYTLP